MSDWLRLDTREQAVEWLDQQLDTFLDKMRDDIAAADVSEDVECEMLQLAYRHLDSAREAGLAEIDKAYKRLELGTLH